jgi:phage shock protein A
MSEFDLFKGRLEEKVTNLEKMNGELRDSVKNLQKEIQGLQKKMMIVSIIMLSLQANSSWVKTILLKLVVV